MDRLKIVKSLKNCQNGTMTVDEICNILTYNDYDKALMFKNI